MAASKFLKNLFFLLVLLLSFQMRVFGAQRGCVQPFARLVGGIVIDVVSKQWLLGYDTDWSLELYEDFHRLLFLSDGHYEKSLAREVGRRFPGKQVISADVENGTVVKLDNLTIMPMDNTKTFPFADNSFDSVVLRRGLCICDGKRACAGFAATKPYMKSFLGEVVRVLDKRNPKSQAFLHGVYNVTPQIAEMWMEVAREIEVHANVDISILNDQDGHFHAILVRVRNSSGG